jgi:hypothetical protein
MDDLDSLVAFLEAPDPPKGPTIRAQPESVIATALRQHAPDLYWTLENGRRGLNRALAPDTPLGALAGLLGTNPAQVMAGPGRAAPVAQAVDAGPTLGHALAGRALSGGLMGFLNPEEGDGRMESAGKMAAGSALQALIGNKLGGLLGPTVRPGTLR